MSRVEIYCGGVDTTKIVDALKKNYVTGNFGVLAEDTSYVVAEDYSAALVTYEAFILGYIAAQ